MESKCVQDHINVDARGQSSRGHVPASEPVHGVNRTNLARREVVLAQHAIEAHQNSCPNCVHVVDRCPASYTHLRAHETKANLVRLLLLEKKQLTLRTNR